MLAKCEDDFLLVCFEYVCHGHSRVKRRELVFLTGRVDDESSRDHSFHKRLSFAERNVEFKSKLMECQIVSFEQSQVGSTLYWFDLELVFKESGYFILVYWPPPQSPWHGHSFACSGLVFHSRMLEHPESC